MNKKRRFYGKWIVFGSIIITVFTMAIINNTPAFYMTPITSEFNFTTAQFSVSYSMAALGAAVGVMLAGTLIEKLPLRLLMLIGAVGTGVSFMAMSLGTQLWHFYVLLFCADMFMGFIANVPITSMLNNWYIDKRGMVTGLVFAGAGLGSVFLSPLTEYFIQTTGWQTTAILAGVVILVTAIPVSAAVFYKEPAVINQEPFTYPEGSPQALKAAEQREKKEVGTADDGSKEGVPRKIAMRSSAFVFLVLGLFCMGMISSGVMVHIPNFLYDINMNAGVVMSLLSVGILIGTFVSGVVVDKFGIGRGILMSTVLFILGMICLYFTAALPALAYVMAVLVGFSVCIAAVGPPLLTASIFGMKDYSFLYGVNYALFLLGCIVGPVFCGIIYDVTSSYNLVWLINIAIAVGMFAFSVVAIKTGVDLRKRALQQS